MILVIDESELLFGLLEPMLEGGGVPAIRAKDVPSAKRKLLEVTPRLVLAFTKIGTDESAGYRFCTELQNHPTLSTMPVLLFSNELTETVIRQASESGARGIAPWPISAESLLRRISLLIPELVQLVEQGDEAAQKPAATSAPGGAPAASAPSAAPKSPAAPAKPAAPVARAPQAPSPAAGAPPKPLSDLEQKLQIAQQILARVLYDLKMSHLLQVVDIDDVPSVLAEITRSACANFSGADKEKRPQVLSPINLSIEGGQAATSGKTPAQSSPAAAASPSRAGAAPQAPAGGSQSPPAPSPGTSGSTKPAETSGVSGMDLDKIFGLKKSS